VILKASMYNIKYSNQAEIDLNDAIEYIVIKRK